VATFIVLVVVETRKIKPAIIFIEFSNLGKDDLALFPHELSIQSI